MAEGTTTVNPLSTMCLFCLNPSCRSGRNGIECNAAAENNASRDDRTVCRFFLKGICKFGDNCWFSHSSSPRSGATSKSKSRVDKRSAGPSSAPPRNQSSARREVNKSDSYQPRYCVLNQSSVKSDKGSACGSNPPNWVNAPEFVPKTTKTYADTLKSNTRLLEPESHKLDMEMCSYFFDGECPYNEECPCIHGNLCELCGKYCLNPYDERQRKFHIEMCEKELEQDMELSFAIQRSLDKTCGICMDIIVEKEALSERRFGILEKCNHVFCLPCIRKWRKVKSFESASQLDQMVDPGVTRTCPECRISSDFIIPSQYWVDTDEEKKKLISDYKLNLAKKPCKYFKQGKGMCPFGGACFYLHAKPDGTKVELPPPTRRRRQNQEGELDFMGRIILWDYLEVRDQNNVLMHLDLDDLVYAALSSSTDHTDHDTESSEEDFFLSEAF